MGGGLVGVGGGGGGGWAVLLRGKGGVYGWSVWEEEEEVSRGVLGDALDGFE